MFSRQWYTGYFKDVLDLFPFSKGFWWFQGKRNLINSVKFAWCKKQNLARIPKIKGDWLRNLVNYIVFCRKRTLRALQICTIFESLSKPVLGRKPKAFWRFQGCGKGKVVLYELIKETLTLYGLILRYY